MSIDLQSLLKLLAPASAVVTSVMIKNGSKQIDVPVKPDTSDLLKKVGPALFVAGWVGVAYVLTKGRFIDTTNSKMITVASALIVGAVFVMMRSMMNDRPDGANMIAKPKDNKAKIAKLVFAGAWLLLGYATAKTSSSAMALPFGIGAALMTIISMMVALPWQRKHGVVDGPGLVLFTGAWVALGIAGSL